MFMNVSVAALNVDSNLMVVVSRNSFRIETFYKLNWPEGQTEGWCLLGSGFCLVYLGLSGVLFFHLIYLCTSENGCAVNMK